MISPTRRLYYYARASHHPPTLLLAVLLTGGFSPGLIRPNSLSWDGRQRRRRDFRVFMRPTTAEIGCFLLLLSLLASEVTGAAVIPPHPLYGLGISGRALPAPLCRGSGTAGLVLQYPVESRLEVGCALLGLHAATGMNPN